MRGRALRLIIAGIVLLAVAVLLLWTTRQPGILQRFAKSISPSAWTGVSRGNEEAAKVCSDRLTKAVADLKANKDLAKSRAILAELRKLLDSLPPNVASEVIQAFLKSGQDAGTKLDVTIQAGCGLGDASSLRVFLMDYLGRIDKPAAGRIAMEVLSQYTTPDEWAVSLRNFAWANPDSAGYGYLRLKAREFLANGGWRKNPS